MTDRLLGWPPAVLAMVITVALVVGELTNAAQRRWWDARPLTTDTVSGLLVLLITVLVVNQLLNRRQAHQRGRAVAAQAAIMAAQATRSVKAMSSALSGSGDRDAASDGFRTYMSMLLQGAPVLIEDPVARHFLEQAQYLGAVMATTLMELNRPPAGTASAGTGSTGTGSTGTGPARPGGPAAELDDAVRQFRGAAAPLVHLLSPATRDSLQRLSQTAEE